MGEPAKFTDVEALVTEIVKRRGTRLKVALPLGLGKPTHIANELVRQAESGDIEDLTIFTALTLVRPTSSNMLQQRLMEPIVDRLYRDYPDLRYAKLRAKGELPENVTVHEFYFQPGAMLGNDVAQQNYLSINYTEAFRIARVFEIDVLAQLVAPSENGYDLGGNTDISLELIPELHARDDEPLVVGQVNHRLPAMGREALLSADSFDLILDDEKYEHELFCKPSMPPSDAEFATGLRVASLLKDHGTIQLGIGNLGDTAAWATILRDQNAEKFKELVHALHFRSEEKNLVNDIGGLEGFDEGLYASSEMLTEGLLEMYKAGVIRRTVEDGISMHAAFFLGSPSFYDTLRDLDDEHRSQIAMTSVRWTNLLYGNEETKRKHRTNGRFINEGMMVTLLGGVVSDQLSDGGVVSGVGGQFEFVTMANALPDARSIIMIPSFRESRGQTTSNIVWNYGHTTIPRHLRDIVVTEYGVADLRDKTDAEVIAALIEIADGRFQEDLMAVAKDFGKLPEDYELPAYAQNNTPEAISEALAPFRESGDIPRCPFGSALSDLELDLVEALQYLRGVVDTASTGSFPAVDFHDIVDAAKIPDSAEKYLKRMGLHAPHGTRERSMRRLLVYALAACDLL
jgi:acyl-CoA hydrolase